MAEQPPTPNPEPSTPDRQTRVHRTHSPSWPVRRRWSRTAWRCYLIQRAKRDSASSGIWHLASGIWHLITGFCTW